MARVTRRAVRYEVYLPLTEVNRQAVAEGYLLDISSLGAKLELPFAVASRRTVEFGFLKPGTQTLLRLSGLVMWMQGKIDQPGRFWHGIQFHHPRWDIDGMAKTWQKP